jgi:two-component system CheB/CheR fusion protein
MVPTPPASERRPEVARLGDDLAPEAVLLTLPVGVVVVDRHYDIASINLTARRLLAIHRPAQGEDLLHLVPASLALPLRAAIDRALHEGDASAPEEVALDPMTPGWPPTRQVEVYLQRNDQTPRAGRYVVVVVQEITQHVEDRRALQQVQTLSTDLAGARQERNTLETMNQRLLERNRHLLETNEELTSTNEELRSNNQEVLLSAEETQAAVEEVETLNEELQASNEDLETLNEELQATVEELNTTNDDLASRSQELQQLTQTREYERARLEAILMSMEDALLVVNRAGVTLLTNAAYARMFGHADADLEAHDAEGQPLLVAETPQQRATHGEAFTMEFTRATAADEPRYYEATGRSISHEELGGVVVIRDITERSLHRLQDRFMVLAGHELRTPLTVLQGTSQVLLRSFAVEPASRALDERALLQCRRLARLVEELLDATRLQYGRYTLQREPVELQHLVAEAIEAIRLTEPRQSIRFDASDMPLVIQADVGRLYQIVLNLLTNALTHAPTSERIDVRIWQGDHEAMLQVQDYGQGIPAADLPNLFERFYQRNDQEHRSGGGLGLGLYITKQLVLAHEGHITVESVEGQGTTFSVSLPLSPGASQAGV